MDWLLDRTFGEPTLRWMSILKLTATFGQPAS